MRTRPSGAAITVSALPLARAGSPDLADMNKLADDWNGRADPNSVGYRLARAFRLEVIDTVLGGFAAVVRAKYPDFQFPAHFQGEHQVDAILARRATAGPSGSMLTGCST